MRNCALLLCNFSDYFHMITLFKTTVNKSPFNKLKRRGMEKYQVKSIIPGRSRTEYAIPEVVVFIWHGCVLF